MDVSFIFNIYNMMIRFCSNIVLHDKIEMDEEENSLNQRECKIFVHNEDLQELYLSVSQAHSGRYLFENYLKQKSSSKISCNRFSIKPYAYFTLLFRRYKYCW